MSGGDASGRGEGGSGDAPGREDRAGAPEEGGRRSAEGDRLRRARARARLARRAARAPLAPETGAPSRVDPAALFRYPRKKRWLAYLLWLTTGWFGGHRFYLRHNGTAAIQFLTGGGFLVWWLIDAALIPRYVREHNEDQAGRELDGRPPVALAFLGEDPGISLAEEPDWAAKRIGWSSVVGDALVLMVAGAGLGAVSASTGSYRAVAAVALLALVLNLGARLERLRELPLLGEVLSWSWRLRLFYHRVGPGAALSRLARPITAFLVDPFMEKRRGEAELYLQLGGAVAILFGVVDVGRDVAVPLVRGAGVAGVLEGWLTASAMTFVNTYAFAVPVGASLARPLLARRPRGELWGLTAWAAACVAAGAIGAG